MKSRREFLKQSALGLAALGLSRESEARGQTTSQPTVRKPLAVSTWRHGLAANEAAWQVLSNGAPALDAVEAGVRVTEADPDIRSVGLGGHPDREGKVTLDACVMNEEGNCGAVAFLQHIKHPVSVARLVMENTPHVMLVGEGALQFALSSGFTRENLLTPAAATAWREWLKESEYRPAINAENHDTIGMLAIDEKGNLSGACTTSGAAYKLHGRVGDSPIIGAALFVDNEVGGACTTGLGEAVMKTLTSFLCVEFMRDGATPEEACRRAVKRIVALVPDHAELQVGCLAIDKAGTTGAFSIQPDFSYAVRDASGNYLVAAESYLP